MNHKVSLRQLGIGSDVRALSLQVVKRRCAKPLKTGVVFKKQQTADEVKYF